MASQPSCYIDGAWQDGSSGGAEITVLSALDGSVLESFRPAGPEQVDGAVAAAAAAWPEWSRRPASHRAAVLRELADRLEARSDELAESATREVGSTLSFSRSTQVGLPLAVLRTTADALESLELEEKVDNALVVREPVGVVAAITPWNYPLYQIVAKLAPALAAGCGIVVKPSQVAPLTAVILFEEIHALGLPAGLANLLVGTGREVGEAMVGHPGVAMVSFTGSTSAGIRIGALAARSVKRVALELGGKSATVLLDDADLDRAVAAAVGSCFSNGGQTCSALTRLIVPRQLQGEVERRLVDIVSAAVVGDPLDERTTVGPMATREQQESVEQYVRIGVEEGARVLIGGTGAPPDVDGAGYYVRPTVLTDVTADMRVAQEEIFGPVLAVLAVDGDDEAIDVANDSAYGLGGAVWSNDVDRALSVARRIRTGQVAVNGGAFSAKLPFGGYKQSGNGRELGKYGLEEYFELKAIRL